LYTPVFLGGWAAQHDNSLVLKVYLRVSSNVMSIYENYNRGVSLLIPVFSNNRPGSYKRSFVIAFLREISSSHRIAELDNNRTIHFCRPVSSATTCAARKNSRVIQFCYGTFSFCKTVEQHNRPVIHFYTPVD